MMRRLFSALLSICFLWMAAPSVLAAPTFGFPTAGQPVPRQADCRIYHFRVNAADLPLAFLLVVVMGGAPRLRG